MHLTCSKDMVLFQRGQKQTKIANYLIYDIVIIKGSDLCCMQYKFLYCWILKFCYSLLKSIYNFAIFFIYIKEMKVAYHFKKLHRNGDFI